jgi:hypothetical protein
MLVQMSTALHHVPPFLLFLGGCGRHYSSLRACRMPSPCLHTAAAPTLPSSDRDPSVHHIHTPAPTLAYLSLTQWTSYLLAAVSWLSTIILTAGSTSGLGQGMVFASLPHSCSLVITQLIGQRDVGSSCMACSFEPYTVLASVAVNRYCPASRATGAGVSPDYLSSALIGVMGVRPGLI